MTATAVAVLRTPDRGLLVGSLVAAVAVGAAVARGHDVVVIMLLFAVLYALFFVWNPAVALLVYVATRPAVEAIVLVDVGPVSVGQLWGAGLLVAVTTFVVASSFTQHAVQVPLPRPVVALLVVYALLAARGDSAIGIQYGLKLAGWLLLLVAVERISRSRSGQMVCFRAGYALAVGTSIAVGALAATGKYGAAHYDSFGLEGGSVQDPQALAFLALFSLPFPLVAVLQRQWMTPSLILVGALTVEIVLSFVRTALVGLAVILLVYIFVAARRRRPAAFGMIAAFAATAYFVQDRLADRFADVALLFTGEASGAGSNRIAIWTSIWDATTGSLQTAVVGAGAGTSHALSADAIGHFVDAHNDYLEYFATGGLVLVLVYVLFILWSIRSVTRLYRDVRQSSRARAMAALSFGVIAAFVVVSLLGSISFYVAPVGFAMLLGLISGMAHTPGRTCFDPLHAPHPHTCLSSSVRGGRSLGRPSSA